MGKVDKNELSEVSGGFGLGNDKYKVEEYKKAGIVWTQHTLLPDEYSLAGHDLTQSQAESVTEFYNSMKDMNFSEGQLNGMMLNLINVLKQFEKQGKSQGQAEGFGSGVATERILNKLSKR